MRPHPPRPVAEGTAWPAILDVAYASAFVPPPPHADLADLLTRLAGAPAPDHPHPPWGPLRVSAYAQWYRRVNPLAVTLRLGDPAGGGSGGTIPGAVGIGRGSASAPAAASPLGRPKCAVAALARGRDSDDGDSDGKENDGAALAVFGGTAARWYVNAAGQVLRVGADGVGALVDVGGGVKEGDWPDDPPRATAGTPRTVPFAVAAGGVEAPPLAPAAAASSSYTGEGMVVHLGQHHGTTFYHVYTEVLLRLMATLPILRAYPAARVLLPPSAVTRGAAEAIGIPPERLAPAPVDGEWLPAAVVVVPPPVQQTAPQGMYPKCGRTAVATFLSAALAPPPSVPGARTPVTGAVTAAKAGTAAAASPRPPRTLLWISRSATATTKVPGGRPSCTGKRCVANEADLIAGLAAALGDDWAVSVFPHNGGLVGAVRAFGGRPDIVVGVHGAGWQNMVFAGAAPPTPPTPAAGRALRPRTTPVAIHISSSWRPTFFAPTAAAAGYRWARLYHAGVTHYGTGLQVDVGRVVDAVRAVVGGKFDYSNAAWELQRRGRGVAATTT